MADSLGEIKFIGVENWNRVVQSWDDTTDMATRAAIEDIARLIQGAAQARAPIGETGHLADSIVVQGPDKIGSAEYEAVIGPTAAYGRRVELGFRERGDGVHGHQHTKPNPYFTEAFEATQPEFAQIIREAWRLALFGH